MTPDTIVKYYNDNFNLICSNYKNAQKITGVRNVSSIEYLIFDKENQKIEFTYYSDYITLRKWINSIIIGRKFGAKEEVIRDVFNNIGVFIAKYHLEFSDSIETKAYLSEFDSLRFKNTMCFLHGDLTDNNILINNNNEVIIIDWESTPILNPYFNYGSSLWDVCWFINSLLRPSPGTFFNTASRIRLVKYFIEGCDSITHIDKDLLFIYYKSNLEKRIHSIYKKNNIYNKVLYRKHLKNWRSLQSQFINK